MCLFLLIFLRCGFDVLCVSDWYVMSTTVWIHWIWYYDIIYFLRWTIKNKDTIFWFIPFHTPQQQALQTDTGYFSSISHLPMSANVFQRTFFCLFFFGGVVWISQSSAGNDVGWRVSDQQCERAFFSFQAALDTDRAWKGVLVAVIITSLMQAILF